MSYRSEQAARVASMIIIILILGLWFAAYAVILEDTGPRSDEMTCNSQRGVWMGDVGICVGSFD